MKGPHPKPPGSDSVRPSTRTSGVRTTIALLLLVVLFLGVGGLGYEAYLASPQAPEHTAQLPARPATAQRLVLFLIDGFNPTHAFDPAVMPEMVKLAGEGASGIVHTPPMTTTAPCIFSLTTGRPGNIVQAIFNFNAHETRADSLLSAMVAAGRRVLLAGDPTWVKQFGWLAHPEDEHESPDPGVTIDPIVHKYDREAVDFLSARLRDPVYGILVVHLGSADAAGHVVTPHGRVYLDQLHFLDGLLRHVAESMGPDSLLLVTGDHGMASRGTHGGEEEARRTAYILRGPGIKPGVVADISQTALASTLSGLLGLPMLTVTEYPPLTGLLAVPAPTAERMRADYFAGKLDVARQLAPGRTLGTPASGGDTQLNERLNIVLFGAADPRVGLRLLSALTGAVAVVVALALVWSSAPAQTALPPLPAYLAIGLALPIAIAVLSGGFMAVRESFPYTSHGIALVLAAAWLLVLAVAGAALYRSPALRQRVERWQLALFFPVMVALSAPLVNSHWLQPQPFFGALLLGAALLYALRQRGSAAGAYNFVWVPLAAALFFGSARIPAKPPSDWSFLGTLTLAIFALSVVNIRKSGAVRGTLAILTLGAAFTAAWGWQIFGGTRIAWVVIGLSLLGIAGAVPMRNRAISAATLLIAGSAALYLMLADNGTEATVFLAAALVALALSRVHVDLTQPRVLYLAVGLALLVRICLYFQLGDQYNFSSIRTAPGFRLVNFGLPLGTVAALLVLKYVLPWLVILGALLPSLTRAGRQVTRHVLELIALGYVARFAVVAAVIDPLRILPNGLDGIVGMFCITWAEFLTFAVAALVLLNAIAERPALAALRQD